MKQWITNLGWLLALLATAALWAQQPENAPEPDPLTKLEHRVSRIENTLAGMAGRPSALTDASIDSRLQRVEASLNRVETQLLRGGPSDGGMMTARMMDSRLRALESQVARLQR